MRLRILAATLVLTTLLCSASAQSYSIRVIFNTNLRSSNSLTASIVETAPAGTILTVLGEVGRWLQINRNGATVWMASWVRHERVEVSQQTQTPQQQTNIDNCCFVDRQCSTDQEWTDGYWAFQNSQCAAPVQTAAQPQTSAAPVTAPSGVDNCCQVNRQCHSNDDWVRGFYDFRDNQCQGAAPATSAAPITGPILEGVDNCCFVNWACHSKQDYVSGYERFKYGLCHVPSIAGGIRLDGSGAFQGRIKDALRLLLDREPRWYSFAISGLTVIRERPGRSASVSAWNGTMKVDASRYPLFDLAAIIVHEACHAHRYKDGLVSGGYHGERDCTEKEVEVLRKLAPGSSQLAHEEWLLANMQDTDDQWWHN